MIDEKQDANRLSLTAYYQPRGIFGILYWYMVMPFHYFVFNNLIDQIEKRA